MKEEITKAIFDYLNSGDTESNHGISNYIGIDENDGLKEVCLDGNFNLIKLVDKIEKKLNKI